MQGLAARHDVRCEILLSLLPFRKDLRGFSSGSCFDERTSTVPCAYRPQPALRIVHARLRQRPAEAGWPLRAPHAQSLRRAAPSRPARGTPGHEAGALRRRLGGRLRRRRGAQGVHPGDPEGAGRRCSEAAVHRDGAPARIPVHRRRDDGRLAASRRRRLQSVEDRSGPAGFIVTGNPEDALRSQRRCQHRLPGGRRWSDRSGVRDGVGVASGMLLDRADVRAVSPAVVRVLARDPVRQARHRTVRSGGGAADARTAHGRRAGGDGGGRLARGGAARRLRRRTDVQSLRHHLSGEDPRAPHDRHLRQAVVGARLSLGADQGGARALLRRDARRTGEARSASIRGRRAGPPIRRSGTGGATTCGRAPVPAPRSR